MFRWRRVLPLSLRLFRMHSMSSDPLLDQLITCTNQFQIFQLVGIHKSKLTVQHVGCAINTLWEIQKERPSSGLNLESVRHHPEFIALRILAENKIDFMNDTTLVDTLYAVIRFHVEGHDSLVQQLLVEGWRRLERFEQETLSKFSVCLEKIDLGTSPLMGKIANVLNTNLDNIQNIRVLSSLMIKTFPVTSTTLQHRLLKKAESLLESSNPVDLHSVRRIVQFLFFMKYDDQPLLDKCNQIFVRDIKKMSTDTMCIVTGLYRQMSFKQYEFHVMVKSALLELSNLWNNGEHFGKIFCALFPMASQETRNRLEDDLVILADKIHHITLVYILETMAEAECKNPMLIQKICSAVQENLDLYHRLYLCKITDALVCLPCQNYQLFADLQKRLTAFMKTCFVPTIVVMMTRSLSLLTRTKVDEAILTKIDAVIPQCDLSDLNSIANSIIRWLQPVQVSRQNKSGLYEKLLHKVSRHGLERIRNMDNIDILLNELTYMMNGQWLQNVLIDDILHTCQCLLHQVTWMNAPFLALVTSYCNTLCPPVLDKIAEVTMENITKKAEATPEEATAKRASGARPVHTGLVMMTRSLSLLTRTKVDEAILTKIDAVIPQCDLSDLNSIANSIIRWLQPVQVSRQNKSGLYEKLLHKVSRHGLERIRNMDNIDILLNELTYMMNGQWLQNVLIDDILHTCQCLLHQVTWMNAPFLALVTSYCNTLCPPVLDKIAEVTMENITKIHPTDLNRILYAFANLNYDPPREEEFFNMCIQHILANLNSFPPHLMVLVGFTLAVAQYFPEELIKSIFNIGFLSKLDSELDTFPPERSAKIRMRLMQLNRAVCLECPEYQVPWFHEEYCRQLKQRDANSKRSIYHQIHLFLGDIFGGINYAKMFVITPYYYTVDFECILNKNRKPIAYMDENKLSSNVAEVQWGLDGQLLDNKSLPHGAQRVAIEFLNPVAFCRNSSKIKGLNAMKKRHLEILGYYVVQIPSFEWNSMELGTKDTWINYLRKKIFANEL